VYLHSVFHTLQETTARLLFMAVRWVRCLAPFQTLSKRDQVSRNVSDTYKIFWDDHI